MAAEVSALEQKHHTAKETAKKLAQEEKEKAEGGNPFAVIMNNYFWKSGMQEEDKEGAKQALEELINEEKSVETLQHFLLNFSTVNDITTQSDSRSKSRTQAFYALESPSIKAIIAAAVNRIVELQNRAWKEAGKSQEAVLPEIRQMEATVGSYSFLKLEPSLKEAAQKLTQKEEKKPASNGQQIEAEEKRKADEDKAKAVQVAAETVDEEAWPALKELRANFNPEVELKNVEFLLIEEKEGKVSQFPADTKYLQAINLINNKDKNVDQMQQGYTLLQEVADFHAGAQGALGYGYATGAVFVKKGEEKKGDKHPNAEDNVEAEKYLKMAAEKGDPRAQYNIGIFYLKRYGFSEAKVYLEKVASTIPQANYLLGLISEYGFEDFKKAEELYTEAKKQKVNAHVAEERLQWKQKVKANFKNLLINFYKNDPEATFRLSFLYKYGIIVRPDTKYAKELLQKAASLGYQSARQLLAQKPEEVKGMEAGELPQEVEEEIKAGALAALPWLTENFVDSMCREIKLDAKGTATEIKLKAEANDAKAQFEYAICLLTGTGVEKKDEKQAVELLQKSATQKLIKAQHLYENYLSTSRDYIPKKEKKAGELFSEAAKKGFIPAQYSLGLCYLSGVGVDKDERKAAELFHQAAAKGFPLAHHGFLTDIGSDKDKRTVSLFKVSASLTSYYLPALYGWELCYENGIEVGQKDGLTTSHFILTAALGHLQVRQKVEAREKVVTALARAHVAREQKILEEQLKLLSETKKDEKDQSEIANEVTPTIKIISGLNEKAESRKILHIAISSKYQEIAEKKASDLGKFIRGTCKQYREKKDLYRAFDLYKDGKAHIFSEPQDYAIGKLIASAALGFPPALDELAHYFGNMRPEIYENLEKAQVCCELAKELSRDITITGDYEDEVTAYVKAAINKRKVTYDEYLQELQQKKAQKSIEELSDFESKTAFDEFKILLPSLDNVGNIFSTMRNEFLDPTVTLAGIKDEIGATDSIEKKVAPRGLDSDELLDPTVTLAGIKDEKGATASIEKKVAPRDLDSNEEKAVQEDPDSNIKLGICYAIGWAGLEKDEAKAAALFKRAAEANSQLGQYAYGLCLATNFGVKEDAQAAAAEFKKATEVERSPYGSIPPLDIIAQQAYGLCLGAGFGVEKDEAKAAEAFKKGVDNRPVNVISEYFYGLYQLNAVLCEEYGLGGTPKNEGHAAEGYAKAKEAKDPMLAAKATKALERLQLKAIKLREMLVLIKKSEAGDAAARDKLIVYRKSEVGKEILPEVKALAGREEKKDVIGGLHIDFDAVYKRYKNLIGGLRAADVKPRIFVIDKAYDEESIVDYIRGKKDHPNLDLALELYVEGELALEQKKTEPNPEHQLIESAALGYVDALGKLIGLYSDESSAYYNPDKAERCISLYEERFIKGVVVIGGEEAVDKLYEAVKPKPKKTDWGHLSKLVLGIMGIIAVGFSFYSPIVSGKVFENLLRWGGAFFAVLSTKAWKKSLANTWFGKSKPAKVIGGTIGVLGAAALAAIVMFNPFAFNLSSPKIIPAITTSMVAVAALVQFCAIGPLWDTYKSATRAEIKGKYHQGDTAGRDALLGGNVKGAIDKLQVSASVRTPPPAGGPGQDISPPTGLERDPLQRQ